MLGTLYEHALTGLGCGLDTDASQLLHVQNVSTWSWLAASAPGDVPASLRLLAATVPDAPDVLTAVFTGAGRGAAAVTASAACTAALAHLALVLEVRPARVDDAPAVPSILDALHRHQQQPPADQSARPQATLSALEGARAPATAAPAMWAGMLQRVCGHLATAAAAPATCAWRRAVFLDHVSARLGLAGRGVASDRYGQAPPPLSADERAR